MAKITEIKAHEILDSRGNPTVETTVVLEDGAVGISSVPSGSSVGKYEAVEFRDGDEKRFSGMGVLKAVAIVNEKIGPRLIGQEGTKQQDIDTMMVILDSTENKANLGANSILSVSQAVARAASLSLHVPLFQYLGTCAFGNQYTIGKIPIPIFNLINGGLHGVSNLDFQEFLVIPASSKSTSEAVSIAVNIYHKLKDLLVGRNANYSVGDEGGFTPNFFTNVDGLVIMTDAMREAGYRLGFDAFLGLDLAASHLKNDGGYKIRDRSSAFSQGEFIDYCELLHKNYNILYFEDPLDQDDWDGFTEITKRLSETSYIVGDDFIATNQKRLDQAIAKKSINSVVIKPNQIGTVTEAIHVALSAKKAGLRTVVSHRSGETTDDFIADFAVAVEADYAKFGAPVRGERVVKYNRLLRISEDLKKL